MGCIIIFQI